MFRILQYIPSKRVEQFKSWLAKVGYERLQEYQNLEHALKRIYADYATKGYPQEWIQKRIKPIAVRNQLTKEWDNINISDRNNKYIEGREYAILIDVISEGTFGVKSKHHKEIKGLKKQPLKDHMTKIELIFNMLGEQVNIDEIKDKDAQGYNKKLEAAKGGGKNAGTAREAFEKARGVIVVS
ncbi:MAG: hypothetical protein ACR5K5_04580 [Wolbachia sp.]